MTGSCAALDTPNTKWSFCPNIGAAYLFTILFLLTTLVHLAQAIFHRKAYCWVVVASGLAQTLAYIFRVTSIKSPASFGDYAAWFILILIAPLFTNAFTYMVMGRMIWNYVTDATIWKITAWRFGLYFVILDIVALLIQIYGAASASGDNATSSQILDGLHVYMGGVGIQQFFIFVFLFFAFKFHQTLRDQSRRSCHTPRQAWSLLYALYAVILLITIRIIFRLVEYSQGLKSSIPNHEAFQYSLDSVPMLFALVILNIFHPGRIMADQDSSIPGRKERKGVAFRTKMQKIGNSDVDDVQMV
ncbi:putative rta1 domain-containing protein [Botrytis fragariae]|uniref:Putative rta1 domain-containing protein n=1 Tax=Botrytis fragariae TaxID=1964551 RepID=A0A8H6END9_9HELO|nr:putative rta1 domain-containing protein [Botrytis fragariae]KAF5878265.1 putative rta1 domain-containing protein [Botrytis fragariae]